MVVDCVSVTVCMLIDADFRSLYHLLFTLFVVVVIATPPPVRLQGL